MTTTTQAAKNNPCCSHPGCRPSTSERAAAFPHYCSVRPFDKCPAYVPFLGCLPADHPRSSRLVLHTTTTRKGQSDV